MGVPAGQEVTPNKYRPWTMGFGQALSSTTVIAGALGAGADVKYHSFRWSYYTNGIAYGVTAVLVAAFYWPPPTGLRRQGNRLKQLAIRIDYVGILLFTGSIASLVIGLTWGGESYPWNSGMRLEMFSTHLYSRYAYRPGHCNTRGWLRRPSRLRALRMAHSVGWHP